VPTLVFVDEFNQDAMSQIAGRYLHTGSQLWVEAGMIHHMERPALHSPDGSECWYVFGREVTRDVRRFFQRNNWSAVAGLDTAEKRARFRTRFTC
jgi:hypothetical protein